MAATKLGVQTQPSATYLSEVTLAQSPVFLAQNSDGSTDTGSSALITIAPSVASSRFNLPYTSAEPIATTHTVQPGSTTTALLLSPALSFPTLLALAGSYAGRRFTMRFSASTTTVALQGVRRVIGGNTGTTQLDLATALGAVPVAGDVIEVHSGFESPLLAAACVAGVATFPSFSISGNASTTLNATSSGLTGISTNAIANAGTYYRGAELPRATVDTTYPAVIGAQYTVGSGKTYATVQAAYNAAVAANLSTAIELLIDPGTYPEAIQLKLKTNPGEIVFRRAGSHIAPQGTRVQATWFLTGQVKIAVENSRAVVQCDAGACYVRFCGVEIAQPVPAGGIATDLISVMYFAQPDGADFTDAATYPHHIIVDRCYVHGGAGIELRKGIVLGGASMAVVDSEVSDIFNLTVAAGGAHSNGDTNAIVCTYGTGLHKLDNNYLNSAGEIVLYGGADPFIAGQVPSDITVTRNLIRKPLAWAGTYQAKNNSEFKNVRRVLFEGNICDGSWSDAQDGTGILFSSVNQNENPAHAWQGVRDVVFRKNAIRNMTAAFTLTASNTWFSYAMRRVVVEHVAGWNINGVETYSGANINRLAFLGGGIDGLVLNHLTLLGAPGHHTTGLYFNEPSNPRSDVTNSIVTADQYGVLDTLGNFGSAALAAELPDGTFAKNLLIDRVADGQTYPASSYYPATNAAVGFVNAAITSTWATADPDTVCAALALAPGGTYSGVATDATDPGADMTALRAAIAGVLLGAYGPQTATKLAMAQQPSSPIASGAAHGTQPTVQVQDVTSVAVATDTSTVTATLVVESGSATPLGTLTRAAVAGLATFVGLGATSAAGATAHWRFTDGALTSVNSATFTITPSPQTVGVVTPAAGKVNGRKLQRQPVVAVYREGVVDVDATGLIVVSVVDGNLHVATGDHRVVIKGYARFTKLALRGASPDALLVDGAITYTLVE